jgi:hypothetical protein
MPDETTLRKPGEGAPQDTGKETTVAAPKVENKTDDSAKKIAELESQRLKDKADADAKIAALEFENGFNNAANKYPHAAEYKDRIQELVKGGKTVDEATVLVLHGEGKLQTRQDIETATTREMNMGGSADFQPPRGQKRPEEMSQEELRTALIAEEQKGNFKLVEG